MKVRTWAIEDAMEIADEFRRIMRPLVTRCEVVGSVRRKRPRVHNLDLLLIPKRGLQAISHLLVEMAMSEVIHLVPTKDPRTIRFIHCATGMVVLIHVAWNMEDWWPRLVWFTGSKEFNRRMSEALKSRILTLLPDGRGLIYPPSGKPAIAKSERGFFAIAKVPFVKPEERER